MSKGKRNNPKLKVNWNKFNNYWVKQYKGKKYYLCKGENKSDRTSYNRAVKMWEDIKRKEDAGSDVDINAVREKSSPKKKKTIKKNTRRYSHKRVSLIAKKFINEKMNQAISSNGEDVSYGRVQNIKNRLQHFVDYFDNELLSQITETDLVKWSNKNGKRVASGEIQPSTLRQDFRCVRQLYKWSYKQRIINQYPRNLDDLGKQSKSAIRKAKKKPVLTFTKQEIQKLYKGCDTLQMDSKWWGRTDTEIEMLKLAIVLAVNTGMTQQDLSDLTMGELHLGKRPPRCIRLRSKTGQDSNHWLFRESVRLLKEHCEGKKGTDKVLLRRDGRPLVIPSMKNGMKTGSRSDALGASFKRLVERVLGEDDPRRFRELRRTGANFCKQREAGTETLYLSHADGRMSSLYTKPAQKRFDVILTYLEADMGFAHGYGLYKLPAQKSKKKS